MSVSRIKIEKRTRVTIENMNTQRDILITTRGGLRRKTLTAGCFYYLVLLLFKAHISVIVK